ncbi:MAG TPA: hypothetical protein PKU94_08925, partial [Candidatus Hydrothermia bacterium]|nr:hypothetical protein [Candidatus Hydrothermia bacterium]
MEKKIRNELNECENRLNILNKELENKIKEMDKITVLEKVGELKEEEKEELNQKISYLQNEISQVHEKKEKLKEKINGIEPIRVVWARKRRKLAKKLFEKAIEKLEALEKERTEAYEKLRSLKQERISLENKKKLLESYRDGRTRCKIIENKINEVWLDKNEIRERTTAILNYKRWKEYNEIESLQAKIDEIKHDIIVLQKIADERQQDV